MSKLRFPWYVASIISVISFGILYAIFLEVSESLFNFPNEPPGGHALWAVVIAFIISSIESVLIAKDKKIFSISLIWAFFLIISFVYAFIIASVCC